MYIYVYVYVYMYMYICDSVYGPVNLLTSTMVEGGCIDFRLCVVVVGAEQCAG